MLEKLNREYLLNFSSSTKDHIIQKRTKNMGKDDLLSPTSDLVFKMMFQTEERIGYLSYLVGVLLNLEYEWVLKNIELYKTDFDKKDKKEISQRGDLVAKLVGVFLSVEMNNKNELERNVEYTHRLYSATRRVGNHDLHNFVIQINIDNFTFKNTHNTIEMSQAITSDGFLRVKIVYIDVYLPLINRKYKQFGIDSLDDKERILLALFVSKKSDALKLAKGDEILMKYIDDLESLTIDKYLWRAYDHRASEIEAGVERGIEQGLEQGLERGRKESSQKIIKNMYESGMNLEMIHEIAKIPVDEINSVISLLEQKN